MAASAPPVVEVRLLSGQPVAVGEACALIGELRERAAAALGVLSSRLRLMSGANVLGNHEAVAELAGEAGALLVTAVLLEYSPVLSGHSDGIVRRWDLSALDTPGPAETVQGHGGPVLAMSADWRAGQLLTGAADWTLRHWLLRDTGCSLQLEGVLMGHNAPVNAVAADFTAARAVSGSQDGSIRFWDLEAKACLSTFEGHLRRAVYTLGLCLGPVKHCAVSGGKDSRLHVWDLEAGQLRGRLEGHGNTVLALKVDASGHHMISGSKDRRLRLWDLEAMACEAALTGHDGAVIAVSADFEAKRALSGSEDATLRLWDLAALSCLIKLSDWHGPITALSVNFRSWRAAAGSEDGFLSLWDLSGEGRRLAAFEGDADSGCVHAVSIEGGV
mmetsp:Transcript_80501/g.227892  ORF Transcript_80501/g.227892 Transcript_80501/m.227892 type:complete len:388 (-) Transcript_80501:179-1342(-)